MKADLTNINHYPIDKLLIALRKHDELVFPEADYFIEQYPDYKNNCIKFLKESGIDVTEVQDTNLFNYCDIQLERLVRDGLINQWNKYEAVPRVVEVSDNSFLNLSHRVYTLTAKGLDFALKIEAHNDTNEHNKLIRKIGIASFSIAFLSILVSGYLMDENISLSKERLKISQDRIESLEKQIGSKPALSKEELKQLMLEVIKEQNEIELADKVSEEPSTKQPTKVEPSKPAN